MKVTIEIDATPQEVRELIGLPDVQSLQQEALEKIREKLLSSIESNEIAELMKCFMPLPEQISAMEGFQKTMWDALINSASISATSKEK